VTRLDAVVRGGTVVLEDATRELDVGVRDGRIAVLALPGTLPAADTDVDAGGCLVLPGGIDSHTHIRWPVGPGDDSLDDFATGTLAAAAGGTTTVLDFVPRPAAGTSHWDAALARRAEAEGRAVTDFSFHPILGRADAETLRDIGRLIDAGMASFKIYTTFEQPLDDAEIRAVSAAIAAGGGLAGFHAENHDIVTRAAGQVLAAQGAALSGFPRSRPATAESESIAMVTHYARELGAPVFIYHVSSAAALRSVRDAAALGTAVAAETCTHYLVFDDSVYEREDAWKYVITPPIRGLDDQEQLWSALRDGTLGCIASDHCAYGLAHKMPAVADFTRMPPGSPGISARVPFAWSRGVGAGRTDAVGLARMTSTAAARIFGLYPRKGVLAVGSDADLVVLDPDREWTWPAVQGGLGSDYDTYEGLPGRGLPVLTMVRGRVVARDGSPADPTPTGRFVAQHIDTTRWPGRGPSLPGPAPCD
jgi:dihydropyrimidinase